MYSSVSDTNEDGLSFFEFEAFSNIDYYVMVVSRAATQVLKLTVVSGDIVESYALDNRTYTGAYRLKIDDVSHIEEMATTLHLAQPSGVRRVKVTTGSTGPSIPVADRVAGLDRTVAFYTGDNSGGYVLNRIEAAVSETEISQFPANAKVSIYSDGVGSPGTELFTLKTPADIWAGGFDDYEESFWVPSGTTADLAADHLVLGGVRHEFGRVPGRLPPRPGRQRHRRCQIGVEHPRRLQNQEPHHRQRPLDAVRV